MKTPVVIAAHNEEALIGSALDGLDRDSVEPIVAVNGSTDSTAEIARSYTNNVLELPEAGKMPAIQAGIRYIGERALNEPVLFMDADSRPAFSSRWVGAMTRPLAESRIGVTAGLVAYNDGRLIDRLPRSTSKIARSLNARRDNEFRIYGANMAVKFDETTRDAILDFPNVWPSEDLAITERIQKEGGIVHQSIDPRSLVLTSARFHPFSVFERIKKGRNATKQAVTQNYLERKASGTTHTYRDGEFVPVEEAEKLYQAHTT